MRETLAGLAALPENQREALLRTAVGGDSRAQIAHDLGVSDGAVRALVHRARTTLRAAATAVTPAPVAIWAAGAVGAGEPTAARIAERRDRRRRRPAAQGRRGARRGRRAR